MNRSKQRKTKTFSWALLSLCVCQFASASTEETQAVVQSRSFLDQFVTSGGPIVWFVLLPISMFAFYLAVDFLITIRKKKLLPANVGDNISAQLAGAGINNLKNRLADKNDIVSKAIFRALNQANEDRRSGYYRVLIVESLQEQALELLRKIDWLNIIGNVAPMIGLFGTVFGMIKAFNGIVDAGGQPRPDQLASGISLALVTTFWGLLVAIPSLAIHGFFRNKIETIASEASLESETVLNAIAVHLKEESYQDTL